MADPVGATDAQAPRSGKRARGPISADASASQKARDPTPPAPAKGSTAQSAGGTSLRSLFLGRASTSGFSLSSALGDQSAQADCSEDGNASPFGASPFAFGALGALGEREGSAGSQGGGGEGASSDGFTFGSALGDSAVPSAQSEATDAWKAPEAVWGQEPTQSFMRQSSEEELREHWVEGRRDARAAYKKRYQDATRQHKLMQRRGGGAVQRRKT